MNLPQLQRGRYVPGCCPDWEPYPEHPLAAPSRRFSSVIMLVLKSINLLSTSSSHVCRRIPTHLPLSRLWNATPWQRAGDEVDVGPWALATCPAGGDVWSEIGHEPIPEDAEGSSIKHTVTAPLHDTPGPWAFCCCGSVLGQRMNSYEKGERVESKRSRGRNDAVRIGLFKSTSKL